MPARVLVVCTANQLRSPMAELLLRQELMRADPAAAWEVSSAGTCAVAGAPIHPLARDVLTTRGIDVEGFRSRSLTPAMVAAADLILTAERIHCDDVVALVPDAVHRTFTLRQFARLARVSTSGALDQHDGERMSAPLQLTRRARSKSVSREDDLTDPIGGGRRKVELTARQIESAIASIVGCSSAVPLIARLART